MHWDKGQVHDVFLRKTSKTIVLEALYREEFLFRVDIIGMPSLQRPF